MVEKKFAGHILEKCYKDNSFYSISTPVISSAGISTVHTFNCLLFGPRVFNNVLFRQS